MDEQMETETTAAPGEDRGALLRQPRFRLGAIIALAVAAGVIAWALIGGGGSSNSTLTTTTPSVKPIPPVSLSALGLLTLSRTVGQPIYWAGPQRGYDYELTRTSTARVFVRYLPSGVKAGAPGAKYLVIATYPFTNAFKALKDLAKGQEVNIPGGGIALVQKSYPQSVHLAYPGIDYQVEVYDPSPARALQVASSGNVKPVH